MNNDHLISAIRSVHPTFDEDQLIAGLEFFNVRQVKAKDTILEVGKVCDELHFAEASIIRCYYDQFTGEEHTLWMKPEQTFITEYKSFSTETPSTFNLQCYEDTTLFSIKRTQLLKLYAKYPDWALFGIHLTEAVHVSLIDVFVNLLSNDATRNYQYIEYAFPRFIQVAPLKDIASMLQISAVSLSRIRAGNQIKV